MKYIVSVIIPDMSTTDPIFFDLETVGLNGSTRLIQLYQPATDQNIYVLDMDYMNIDSVKEWLKDKWLIGHGLNYDFGCIGMTSERFDDTLYLVRTAYPHWQAFSLDVVTKRLVPGNPYGELNKSAMQKSSFKGDLSEEQLRYAATDVYVLATIWEDERIQETREVLAYKIDIISLRYSIQYQNNNIVVDQDAVKIELAKLVDDIATNENALGGINCNSPKQVKEALGTASSDKTTLIRLVGQGSDLASVVYKQRRLLKRRTMLESYNYPWVTTRLNPAGAATGRFTASGKGVERGINSQQMPRDLQYIFNQDTKKTVVVHADYSTAELRAGCSIMKDEAMYRELMEGKDLHVLAAMLASGLPESSIDKDLRQKGKAVSFGKIFGQSWKSFIEFAYTTYGVRFTEAESQAVHNKYNLKYRGISRYHKYWRNHYETQMVETPMGRRNKARLGTDAINFAVQGAIAETMKLAIHYLIKAHPDAVRDIYNVVHDSCFLRVPRGEEEVWAERLVDAMAKGWTEMCKLPMFYYKDIPMPIEVEYRDVVKEVTKGEDL